MSDRPKWMPSVDITLAIVLGSYNTFRTDGEFHRTGLRAQIEALEEMAAADIPTIAPNDPSRYVFSSVTKVTILNKIAALRKELEHG